MQDDDAKLVAELRSHGTSLYRPDHPTALILWKAADAIERIASRLSADHTGVLVEALAAALSRLAHKASCHSVRPAKEWSEHGSASFENCDCEIRAVKVALATVRGEQSPVDGLGET